MAAVVWWHLHRYFWKGLAEPSISDHCVNHVITTSEMWSDHRLRPPVCIIGSYFQSDEKLLMLGFILSTNLCMIHMHRHTQTNLAQFTKTKSESFMLCHSVLAKIVPPNISHAWIMYQVQDWIKYQDQGCFSDFFLSWWNFFISHATNQLSLELQVLHLGKYHMYCNIL